MHEARFVRFGAGKAHLGAAFHALRVALDTLGLVLWHCPPHGWLMAPASDYASTIGKLRQPTGICPSHVEGVPYGEAIASRAPRSSGVDSLSARNRRSFWLPASDFSFSRSFWNERSYRMFRPDGNLLPHHQAPWPMCCAPVSPCANTKSTIERPDGLRGIALVDIEGSQGLRWKHRQRRQLLPGYNGAQTQ
jgi:hypothetical protein